MPAVAPQFNGAARADGQTVAKKKQSNRMTVSAIELTVKAGASAGGAALGNLTMEKGGRSIESQSKMIEGK